MDRKGGKGLGLPIRGVFLSIASFSATLACKKQRILIVN